MKNHVCSAEEFEFVLMKLIAIEGEFRIDWEKIIMGIDVYSRVFHLTSITYFILDPL